MSEDFWLDVTESEWKTVIGRLTLKVEQRIDRMYWRGHKRGHLPDGREACDFVSDAILRTISGKNVWNPDKYTLYMHLWQIISARIWNLALREENQDRSVDFSTDYGTNVLAFSDVSVRTVLNASEFAALRKWLQNSYPRDVWLLAETILIDGVTDKRELRSVLGCSGVREVENLQRRLRRALKKYCEKDGTAND